MKKRITARKNNFRSGNRAKLNDADWLTTEHSKNLRTIGDIAAELGVAYNVVATAITDMGVPKPSKTKLREASVYRMYGVNNVGELESVREKALQSSYAVRGKGWKSVGEQELSQFIVSLFPSEQDVCLNAYGVIPRKELYVYIPSHKVAFEYCGLYWHSDKFKPASYHKDKMELCTQHGIRLITVFEDEWIKKPEVVKDKIKHILKKSDKSKVYARCCEIIQLSKATKEEFFNNTHIQGDGPGSITYGLTFNGALVSAMTFIKQPDDVFVLNRYATNRNVVGGFSKLLSRFKQDHNWKQLISFADLRWSDGHLYQTTGWTLDKTLPPDYYWCKGPNRYHKFGFRHVHLKNKLANYDPNKTENENCKLNGYLKLYNCGLQRYVQNNDFFKQQ